MTYTTDTPEGRLKIYRKMLHAYRWAWINPFSDVWVGGFCRVLRSTVSSRFTLHQLTELYDKKPQKMYYNNAAYWFRPGALAPRIKLLRQAIKETELKIKNQKYEKIISKI